MFISRLVISILLVSFNWGALRAQTGQVVPVTDDQVKTAERVNVLVDRYNRTHEIPGYRIQIISSSKKEAARKAKSEFASKFQNLSAYEIYQQPFFIVKVGDFQTKLEAVKFHRDIIEFFPESFVLPDAIQPFRQYTLKEIGQK